MIKSILALVVIALLFGFTIKTRTSNNKQITVIIDAGHGGDDLGASHQGVTEKEITLAIAKKIKLYSEDTPINVVLTRTKDQSKSLQQRIEYSQTNSAFLLISLHVATSSINSSGVEIYYSETADYVNESRNFSHIIKENFQNNNINLNVVKLEPANFHLLKNVNCPSVVLELGFINNQNDKAFLGTPRFQDEIAKAILSSILIAKNN
jgi:N-acetylmuramoyl-L-alanine amidase